MAVKAPLPPFKAPSLAPQKARLLNALCVRRGPWHCPFAGRDARWEILPEAPAFAASCEAELLLGGDVWFASLGDSSILFRHDAFTAQDAEAPRADFAEEDLPEDVRAAVLAALFEPALDALRSLLKMPCSLRALRFDVPAASSNDTAAFGLLLALPAAGALPAQQVFLRLAPASASSAQKLADALNTLPRQPGALAEAAALIPLDASLEAGFVRLALPDAATLAPGDVLIPDVWTAAEGRLTLRIEQGDAPLCAPCTMDAGRAVLAAPLALLAEASEAGTDALTSPSGVDIRLSFELSRISVEAGRLAELTPGYSLPLGADSSTVTVLARGKAIARGRVADMDGVTGILLTETMTR